MDVSGFIGALTGGGNVKIDVVLNTPVNNQLVVPMDHYPSWKLHKNPFWRVKHPQGSQKQLDQPQQGYPHQQMDPNVATNPGMNMQQPNNMMMNQNPMQQQHQQQGMMQPGMMQGQPGMMQGQPGMMQGQPGMMQGQPGMMQGQPGMMQGQPGMMNPNQPYMQQPQMQPHMGGSQMNPPSLVQEGLRQQIVAYEASQDVSGIVRLTVPPGKKVEHLGIKVQFIGRIDMGHGIHEGRPHYDFISLSKELSPPGVLYGQQIEVPFLFKNMDKEHESYRGRNVAVRYFVKVVLERKFLPPINKEHDVWVQKYGEAPTENEAIKMEVGIEDCLHIEFEYERRVFHLQDTIIGKIHFMLVRIKIKHMELAVIRRETSGEGVASTAGGNNSSSRGAPVGSAVDVNNICTETQTLVKNELMDGCPVKGEVIPVKLCLRGIPCDLTPTYKAVNNRFSVRYFLNLVLVDAEDRRYFKQQEIILWRNKLG